jgi:chromosome partitioning protein
VTIKDAPVKKIETHRALGNTLSVGLREIQPGVFADPANTGVVPRETEAARSKTVSSADTTTKKATRGGSVMETMDDSSPLGRRS